MNRVQMWAAWGMVAGFIGVILAVLLLALGILYPVLPDVAGWFFIPGAVLVLGSAIVIACTEVWDL